MKKDLQKPTAELPEANPNPVLSSGSDGTHYYANPAALRLCTSLKLKCVEELLPATHNELVKTCLNANQVQEAEHKVDGHIFLWSYLPTDNFNMVFIYGHDITRHHPQAVLESLNDTLKNLYGLTPAEVKLTLQLVNGFTLKKASEQLGITISTARCQLREIFSKTGTDRQSELIRRLLMGPAD